MRRLLVAVTVLLGLAACTPATVWRSPSTPPPGQDQLSPLDEYRQYGRERDRV
jgi:hypothetical protein